MTQAVPWALTGIAEDRRTLRIVAEKRGCIQPDGVPRVDASRDGVVRIRVRQEVVPGDQVVCGNATALLALDVPLGTALRGRRVRGGPRLAGVPTPERMPRVVGLRMSDAVRALRTQGLRVRAAGHRRAIVRRQRPRPGAAAGRAVTLR